MKLGLDFALGRGHIDVHQVMIEQAKAEAQLHLTSAVTNKMASGYQTLMNMQI
jgi:flagellar hook-basal body complex protein FliE